MPPSPFSPRQPAANVLCAAVAGGAVLSALCAVAALLAGPKQYELALPGGPLAVVGTGSWDPWALLAMGLGVATLGTALLATFSARKRTDLLEAAVAEASEASERYQALIDQSWALIAVIGSDCRLRSVSGAWQRLLGGNRDEAVGSDIIDWLHPGDRPAFEQVRLQIAEPGSTAATRFRLRHADGSWRWFDAVATNLTSDPAVEGTLVTARDVSAEVEAHTALEQANARFAALIEHGSDLITVSDRQGRLMYVSPALPHVLGRQVTEAQGRELLELIHPDDRDRATAHLRRAMDGDQKVVTFECRVAHGNGGWRHAELTAANRLDDPAVGGLVCNLRDVTERVQVVDRLHYQAMHDGLTGLPNRVLLLRRLAHALQSGAQSESRCALLYLDLDGFKKVNDSLGHAAGDAVLTVVAERLRAAVRPSDVVARLGGDEFVVMVDGVAELAAVGEIASRIRATISRPVRLGHRSISVGCSIGIAISDQHAPAALLQEADTALYRAKEKGRNRWEVYDRTMSADARRRLDTEELLRAALDEDGLLLVYQPIVDLTDGRVTGVEALLRLRGADGSLLGPSEFIDVAEESGLIVPVGAGVLDRACRQAAEWQAGLPGAEPMRVAVNISPRQLTSPGLVAQVKNTLAAWELPADRLCLELTENALIDAGLGVRASLRELKQMGVSIALDDFGTGWSSLGYLRRFPIDLVKIDRSFVAGLGVDDNDTEVVRAVVGLGRALGLEVVAEGVETPDQAEILRKLGCDRAQGYLFGRPALPNDLRILSEAVPAAS